MNWFWSQSGQAGGRARCGPGVTGLICPALASTKTEAQPPLDAVRGVSSSLTDRAPGAPDDERFDLALFLTTLQAERLP